ncbi:MAG: hypothetical protein Q8S29_15180, partial [Phreatobacter sp.]|nr:hypothetical protein [Phreatobacter sp.]
LSAVGARTVFDRASFMLVGEVAGGFTGRLNAMVERGFLSAKDREVLEAMTDAGSASAHRAFAPSAEHLTSIMDIVENFLEREFVLREKAAKLKAETPMRQKR